MAISPSSSVQRARAELAARLREIRLDAGLTGRELSRRAGWHEAKTSRIEGAKQATTDADIRAWCRVCQADAAAPDLIAASRESEGMYLTWKRLQRSGMRRSQEGHIPLYEQTRVMRAYCSNVIPGLLQTPAYARALMGSITAFQETPDDVADAVAARMERNRVLHGGGRFALLIEESVLRHRVSGRAAMAEQLHHLLDCLALPSLTFGVIPLDTDHRRMWTLETFTVFDETRVEVELLTAQVTVTAPSEVAVYLRAFEELRTLALFGDEARERIHRALLPLP